MGILDNILQRGCAIYPEARSAKGYIEKLSLAAVANIFAFKRDCRRNNFGDQKFL